MQWKRSFIICCNVCVCWLTLLRLKGVGAFVSTYVRRSYRPSRSRANSLIISSLISPIVSKLCVCVRIHRRANSDFDRLILDWTSYNDVVVYKNRNTVHAKLSLNCLFMHRRLVHVNKSVSRIKVVGIHAQHLWPYRISRVWPKTYLFRCIRNISLASVSYIILFVIVYNWIFCCMYWILSYHDNLYANKQQNVHNRRDESEQLQWLELTHWKRGARS